MDYPKDQTILQEATLIELESNTALLVQILTIFKRFISRSSTGKYF
jgi:hypothetical protein